MLSVDLNCDMGEGMEDDAAIMPFISSVNIACGYHAGDEVTMRRTVGLAMERHVAVGAHPSYPDKENFGRVDMLAEKTISYEAIPAMLTDQLLVMQNICKAYGISLHHVKPHGALYNRAAKDPALRAILCETIRRFDPSLLLYGLSGSAIGAEAERYGLSFVQEVFADRGYRDDGSLTPRTEAGALIEDPALAIRQALQIIREGKLVTSTGTVISLAAGTVCIHGDGKQAAVLARAIHDELLRAGISIKAPQRSMIFPA
jgi:UPF0271 protein